MGLFSGLNAEQYKIVERLKIETGKGLFLIVEWLKFHDWDVQKAKADIMKPKRLCDTK